MSCHEHGRCSEEDCEFQPSIFRRFYGKGHGLIEEEADEFLFGECSKCDQFESDDNKLCARCQHLRIRHLLTCGLEKITLEDDNTSLAVKFRLTRGSKQRKCAFCQVLIQSWDMYFLRWNEDKKQRLERQLEMEDVCVDLTLGHRSEWVREESWRNTFTVSFNRCSGSAPRHRATDEDKDRDKGDQDEGETEDAAGNEDKDKSDFKDRLEQMKRNYLGSGKVSFREPDPSTGRSALEMGTAGSVISWARIQKWLEKWNPEEHSDEPHQRHGVSRMHLPAEFMVIDIKKGCITKAPDGCKYAALSYVWGEPEHSNLLELTSTNLQRLQEPGSLSGELLPATIHDALAVCTKLGIHYLWVDRLCIVQDGSSHKMSQIAAMGSIYSTAYVTICAVAGTNANHGLLGLDTRPRTIFPGGVQISGLILAPCISVTSAGRSEMWWKRGWTYQEYLLSPRKLLFAETHVAMEYGHDCECEGPTAPGHTEGAKELRKKSRFSAYTDIVSGYNSRNLSHATDVYNAFLGIFERTYGTLDELLYGLPRTHFDKALLWHTFRINDEPLPRVSDNDTKIPSWTWARAHGSTLHEILHYCSPVALLMRCDEGSVSRVSNAVTWEQKTALGRIDYSFGDDDHAPSIYAFAAFSLVWEERREHTKLVFPQPLQKMESVLEEKWPRYCDYCKDLARAALRGASPSQAVEDSGLVSRLAEPERLAIWTSVAEVGLIPEDEDDKTVSSFCINDENGSVVGHAFFDLDVDQAQDRTLNQCIALSVGKLNDRSTVMKMMGRDKQLGLMDAAIYPPSGKR